LLYLQGDREDAQRLIERLQLDARDIRAAEARALTALELQQGGKLPATNLLGLLYLQGDREDAQRLIERLQLDARDIRAAEARA
ncbi:hypothetical protein ACLXBB_36965, partial [Pseudomonas aeruginosa]